MKAGNRQYKDSLFRDIFNNKERLPELYEALAGIRTTPEEIKLGFYSICYGDTFCV